MMFKVNFKPELILGRTWASPKSNFEELNFAPTINGVFAGLFEIRGFTLK
jgi:hypothetical protein